MCYYSIYRLSSSIIASCTWCMSVLSTNANQLGIASISEFPATWNVPVAKLLTLQKILTNVCQTPGQTMQQLLNGHRRQLPKFRLPPGRLGPINEWIRWGILSPSVDPSKKIRLPLSRWLMELALAIAASRVSVRDVFCGVLLGRGAVQVA